MKNLSLILFVVLGIVTGSNSHAQDDYNPNREVPTDSPSTPPTTEPEPSTASNEPTKSEPAPTDTQTPSTPAK